MTDSPRETTIGTTPVAVLDAQALDALRQLDPTGEAKLLRRLLDTYGESLGRLLEQVDEAQRRADAAAVRLAVHTLKSSSASVGARDLSQLCAEAEQALRDGTVDGAAALLARLRAEAERVVFAVRLLLNDPSLR